MKPDIEKFRQFVVELDYQKPVEGALSVDEFAKAYRNISAFWVVYHEYSRGGIDSKSLLKEAVADVGQSLVLACQASYKASAIMSRCSIENFLRWTYQYASGGKLVPSTYASDVFSAIKNLELYKNNTDFSDRVNRILDLYKDLCLIVHSAKIDFLSDRPELSASTEFVKGRAEYLIKRLLKVAKLFSEIGFIMNPHGVRSIDPDVRHKVLDVISKEIKNRY